MGQGQGQDGIQQTRFRVRARVGRRRGPPTRVLHLAMPPACSTSSGYAPSLQSSCLQMACLNPWGSVSQSTDVCGVVSLNPWGFVSQSTDACGGNKHCSMNPTINGRPRPMAVWDRRISMGVWVPRMLVSTEHEEG